MNDTSVVPDQAGRSDSWFSNVAWGVLILATLYVCYFSHLGAFGLVGPDEPRYAWIARDMAESGDWVTPRLYGHPWFEKPILYYWGGAIGFKLLGASEVAARLPSAVSAVLATLALAWLALRWGGWETARWVLVLLPSAVGMVGFAHAAAPDMPFSAMLAMAMVCAAGALDVDRRADQTAEVCEAPTASGQTLAKRHVSLFLFGFFLGAAVLAKGPAGLILAGGAVILWAAFTKRWRDALRLGHPLALAAFFITCLPWYVLCARRNPDFLRIFIIEHNFRRYLTPEFQHLQPFWYYLPITLIALLPWVFWLVWFAIREVRSPAAAAARAQILFLGSWGVFPLIFFSLSKSKLPGYILPAIPALSILIALALAGSLRSKQRFTYYSSAAIGIMLVCSAGATAVVGITGAHRGYWATTLGGALLFLYMISAGVGGLVILLTAYFCRGAAAMTCAVVVVLLVLTVAYDSLHKLDAQISMRGSAAQLDALRAEHTYSYKLQRGWQYQLNFYLHREVSEWSPEVADPATVVTTDQHLAELKNNAQIVEILSDLSPQAVIIEVRQLPGAQPGGRQPR